MNIIKERPYSIITGGLLGLLFVVFLPYIDELAENFYDSFNPVVKMSGTLVEANKDYVLITITGEKLRGEECKVINGYGYFKDHAGFSHDAILERIDSDLPSRVRDKGLYNVGTWKVHPRIMDAKSVHISVQHICNGRSIISEVTNIKLG
jgi:hypothetical protein